MSRRYEKLKMFLSNVYAMDNGRSVWKEKEEEISKETLPGAKKYDVYEFDPKRQLPRQGIIVFAGRTGTGKTTAIFDILYYYRKKLDVVIAFVGSEETALEL